MEKMTVDKAIKKFLSQNDVTVTCSCGVEMEFDPFEYGLSAFNCPTCEKTFVHDDTNEPTLHNPRIYNISKEREQNDTQTN